MEQCFDTTDSTIIVVVVFATVTLVTMEMVT